MMDPNRDVRMDLDSLDGLPTIELPEGYRITTAADWDAPDIEARWLGLLRAAFPEVRDWSPQRWRAHITERPQFDPAGVFFIVHAGDCVATAFAWRDDPDETRCGRVHWVASHPDHRGKQLGRLVTLAVLHHLRGCGFPRAFLETQLYRLPAIRVYLKLGFHPTPADDEERERWGEAVAAVGF